MDWPGVDALRGALSVRARFSDLDRNDQAGWQDTARPKSEQTGTDRFTLLLSNRYKLVLLANVVPSSVHLRIRWVPRLLETCM